MGKASKAKKEKRLVRESGNSSDSAVEKAILRILESIKAINDNHPLYKNRDLNIMLTNDSDASETFSQGFTTEQIKSLRSWIELNNIFVQYPKLHIYFLPSERSFFLEDVKEKWMTFMINIKTGQGFDN